jgi:hypothetical protein
MQRQRRHDRESPSRPEHFVEKESVPAGCRHGSSFDASSPSTVPGGLNNIRGNDGKQYAVQSLWSNGDDLPTG